MSALQLPLITEARSANNLSSYRKGKLLEIPEALDTTEFTHGLHRFPGKFIPQIPRYIFETYLPKRSSVLDPFCGSGTTVLESILSNRSTIGCDIDPLAMLITRAKTKPLSPAQMIEVNKGFQSVNWKGGAKTLVPEVPNLTHWFSPEAIRQLSAIKAVCLEFAPPLRDFALTLFSSIIRRVSLADDQTQKTYVSGTHKKAPPEPKDLFPIFLKRATEKMCAFSAVVQQGTTCEVRRHDARSDFSDFNFDHVVTSPPYIDSIDYAYNQMLEYFWLLNELGIGGYGEYIIFRKTPLGMRSDDSELPEAILEGKLDLDEICRRIALVSRKEERAVKTFFSEYEKHVLAVRKKQRRGSKYITVVGSSIIRKELVPTPDALVRIHEASGYRLEDRFTYGIKRHYMKFPRRANSNKIIEDHVLVFTIP
jgi:hypothetical protein